MMRKLMMVGLVFGLGTGIQSGSNAALDFYVKIRGQKQVEIKGDVVQKGREGLIAGIQFHHEIASPRDPASGMATGKRQHKPIMFVTEVGRAHPMLLNALMTNEPLPEVVFTFYKPQIRAATGVGSEVLYMTITLKNANISKMTTISPNNKNPELMRYAAYDEVELTYQSITVTNNETGATADDSQMMKSEAPPIGRAANRAAMQPSANAKRRLTQR